MARIDIDIQPKLKVLNSLGLSKSDFDDALEHALNRLEGKPPQELPTPSQIPLVLGGREHSLGELARIAVTFASGQQFFV